MSDFGPTDPRETTASGRVESSDTSDAAPVRGPWALRLSANRRSRWIAAALACAVIGLSVGLATSGSTTTASPDRVSGGPSHGAPSDGGPGGRPGAGASNARSAPATGGATGTVDSVYASSFTMTTAGGQEVTVDESPTTTYQNGTSTTSASAITSGDSVLALGTTDGTTITATQVTVEPTGDGGAAASAAAGVVPFERGASATSKQVGQIPTNYTEGDGTIVDGAAANEATEAALAAYPGGVVDRVVQLSNGQYEVHNIGVSWPHHVFVSPDFTVVGAF